MGIFGKRGGGIGPYAAGKIYCEKCGEYRRYGENVATRDNGKLTCMECGYQVRVRGRRWIKTAKIEQQPKRY